MRAIIVTEYGGPEVLAISELPDPVPAAGEVLIRVKAFGLNHADTYMRSGLWPFGIKVLGIECAGLAEQDPSGELAPGTPVIALVGGMARTRNGSYAEFVTVPAANVVPVKTALSWADLAAIPEAYATAWTGLIDNLALKPGQTVVVRGATSSVGQAAVNIAAGHGASVIATTRRPERGPRLRDLGASEVLVDDGDIAAQVRAVRPGGADCVLDLVGNAVLRDSLRSVRARGRVCQLGFLAGLAPVAEFNPLADMPSGVQLSTFASAFVLGGEDYPLDRLPLQDLVAKAEQGTFAAKPARVFAFDQIAEAHRIMEAGQANGKLVVTLT